jgi:type I restriction enzyme, S subunit
MSSKTKTPTTTEEATPTLVPKLRFPAFRDAKEWTTETLEDALAMSATYGIVTAGEFQEQGIPMLRGGDIKEGRICDGLPFVTEEINFQYRRTILQANDVVISLVGYPGEAAVVPPRYVGANISRAVGLLRVKHVLSPSFLVCYLNSPAGKRTVLKPSAGSAQVVVNLKQLNALLIPAPTPAEQQKIAECLTSVDDRIAAQARKLDALKTHKKGLMQQLFPREGESQPRLRFPEFRTAGEWEEKKLEDLAKRGSGHTPNKAKDEYYNGGIKWVSLADSKRLDNGLISETAIVISEQGIKNSSAVLHPAGSVILSRDAGVGKSAVM